MHLESWDITIIISKSKSIAFGTNLSLNPKPQLNIVINHVEIEQVEKSKLLGVTLDCKTVMVKIC
jgi:hypothetical protein